MSSGMEFGIRQFEKTENSRHLNSHSALQSTGVLATRAPRMTYRPCAKSPSFDRIVPLANSIPGIRTAGGMSVCHASLFVRIATRAFELCGDVATVDGLSETVNWTTSQRDVDTGVSAAARSLLEHIAAGSLRRGALTNQDSSSTEFRLRGSIPSASIRR